MATVARTPTLKALHSGNPWRRATLHSVFSRTVGERMRFVLLVGTAVFLLAVMMGPMFTAVADSMSELEDSLPDSITAFTGGASLADPVGWMNAELFSLIAPGALILVAVVSGARALTGEEEDGTLAALLANPVSRTMVLLEKAAALVLHLAVVSLLLFAGTWVASLLGDFGLPMADMLAVTVHALLLGVVFGFISLAVGALTGRRKRTLGIVAGVVGAAFVVASQLPQTENLAGLAKVSPWYWYNGTDPLANGFAPGYLLLLVALAACALASALALFRQRDLTG